MAAAGVQPHGVATRLWTLDLSALGGERPKAVLEQIQILARKQPFVA